MIVPLPPVVRIGPDLVEVRPRLAVCGPTLVERSLSIRVRDGRIRAQVGRILANVGLSVPSTAAAGRWHCRRPLCRPHAERCDTSAPARPRRRIQRACATGSPRPCPSRMPRPTAPPIAALAGVAGAMEHPRKSTWRPERGAHYKWTQRLTHPETRSAVRRHSGPLLGRVRSIGRTRPAMRG